MSGSERPFEQFFNHQESEMNIEQRTFLITGGASGLGEATARMLVAQGANVVLADLNATTGEQLAQELGSTARFCKTDVTDEAQMQAAVDLALSAFGQLHGLACCAGIAPGEKVLGKEGPHRLGSFARAVQINLVGTFNAIRLAAEAMSKNAPDQGGQIGQAAYSASKAGVVGMTLPIARELARYGVRVMTVAPGIFETPMLKGLPQAAQDSLGQQVPFPSRLGRPAEFAQLVRSIVENAMLNGEVIRLDGAIRMAAK